MSRQKVTDRNCINCTTVSPSKIEISPGLGPLGRLYLMEDPKLRFCHGSGSLLSYLMTILRSQAGSRVITVSGRCNQLQLPQWVSRLWRFSSSHCLLPTAHWDITIFSLSLFLVHQKGELNFAG